MTNRRLLEFQAQVPDFVAEHNDDCFFCRRHRMMAECAKRVLARNDIPDEMLLLEWCAEIDRERKQQPSNN